MGGDKLWLDVLGRPLIAWTLDALAAAAVADLTVVAAPRDRWPWLRALPQTGHGELRLVEGGERRQDSVRIAAEACAERAAGVILVHDAARPLCPPHLFTAAIAAAAADGAVTAAIPVIDSIKRIDADHRVIATLDRASLVAIQTPQAFRADVLIAAHRRALSAGLAADDDCALVEAMGMTVRAIPGEPGNFKVTTPHDLAVLRSILGARG